MTDETGHQEELSNAGDEARFRSRPVYPTDTRRRTDWILTADTYGNNLGGPTKTKSWNAHKGRLGSKQLHTTAR